MKGLKKRFAMLPTMAILLSASPAALGAWYDDAVVYATENGPMDEAAGGDFTLNESASRGEIVESV